MEEFLVTIENFFSPMDYVIVDIDEDVETLFILERSFLTLLEGHF